MIYSSPKLGMLTEKITAAWKWVGWVSTNGGVGRSITMGKPLGETWIKEGSLFSRGIMGRHVQGKLDLDTLIKSRRHSYYESYNHALEIDDDGSYREEE